MLPEIERTYRELLHRLESRQQVFVSEYLIHHNAAKAARQAGYSTHTARQIGHENLTKPDIAEAIQAGTAMIIERCEVSAEELTRELAAIALSNVLHFAFDDDGYLGLAEDAPSEAIRAVASVTRKKKVTNHDDGSTTTTFESTYKLWDKLTALTLLGKKLRLFVERIETESPQDEAYKLLLKQLREGPPRN
jgi:phage terminase small subunit